MQESYSQTHPVRFRNGLLGKHKALLLGAAVSRLRGLRRTSLDEGSRIASPGLRRWFWAFGARQFDTREPSEFEYDPPVRAVAECQDPTTLRKDRYDDAVTKVVVDGRRGR